MMKTITAVTLFALSATPVFASELLHLASGTAANGDTFQSYIVQEGIAAKGDTVHFIIANRFSRAQVTPQTHKPFSMALYEIIASCSAKTLMTPQITYVINGSETTEPTVVERIRTGALKLEKAPGNLQAPLAAAIDHACTSASRQQPTK